MPPKGDSRSKHTPADQEYLDSLSTRQLMDFRNYGDILTHEANCSLPRTLLSTPPSDAGRPAQHGHRNVPCFSTRAAHAGKCAGLKLNVPGLNRMYRVYRGMIYDVGYSGRRETTPSRISALQEPLVLLLLPTFFLLAFLLNLLVGLGNQDILKLFKLEYPKVVFGVTFCDMPAVSDSLPMTSPLIMKCRTPIDSLVLAQPPHQFDAVEEHRFGKLLLLQEVSTERSDWAPLTTASSWLERLKKVRWSGMIVPRQLRPSAGPSLWHGRARKTRDEREKPGTSLAILIAHIRSSQRKLRQ
ncbi:hypothetical protein B0H10DRAFT_1959588 [Mycena sp. CBHHK59/15]|nr:hypothetical protein B0H10DRAFT_1959588 [Mycena sp. CBHHK59/15]